MPIDTSSYYPEVNGPDKDPEEKGLNGMHKSLFGEREVEKPANPNPSENITPEKKQSDKKKEEGWEKAVTIFSNFLSWAFVPLLMPVYGILFIFKLSILDVISPGLQTAFTFIIAGINFCIPALIFFLLKIFGIVHDIGLNEQKERFIPYLVTAICLGASAWFVASRGAPIWVSMFFAGGALGALINLAINFRWKISAHAAGIAGLVALLIRLEKDVAAEPRLFVWLLITVGVAGLLGTARIWLGRHTVWQVLAGYLVGFCSVFFMMFIR